jgi:hypothetical protein
VPLLSGTFWCARLCASANLLSLCSPPQISCGPLLEQVITTFFCFQTILHKFLIDYPIVGHKFFKIDLTITIVINQSHYVVKMPNGTPDDPHPVALQAKLKFQLFPVQKTFVVQIEVMRSFFDQF